MPALEHRLVMLFQSLESGALLAEALLCPEVSCYGDRQPRMTATLEKRIREVLAATPIGALYQRRIGAVPEMAAIVVELAPPAGNATWAGRVQLRFDYVHWRHDAKSCIAYVPALAIKVVAPSRDELEPLLAKEIRSALARERYTESLERLAWLDTHGQLRVEERLIELDVPTPKQSALAAEKQAEKKSILAEIATDVTRHPLSPAYELESVVAELADALAGTEQKSVLLVGPSGVGKTAAFHELVRNRSRFGLDRTPFWATSGSRLVAGMSGFGMWQERCQRLVNEAGKKRVVLHLGNLIELMEVGKSEGNNFGIASFLGPYLLRGQIVAVAECSPEQLTIIERAIPQLLEAFHQVRVPEPTLEKGRSILLSAALADAGRRMSVQIEAIETLDRLHRRYACYSAYPRRPLRLLRNLILDRASAKTLGPYDVLEAFSAETGLPGVLLDERVSLDLEQTRDWFAQHVIGQSEAVRLVVDLLARVKAGLARPGRPIASLLFIGPTGVGKTEMAKSLAQFLYRNPQRMVRFDISEYADPLGVERLIGGPFGREGLLTARVRQQPFGVVLLDEFEKAHPLLFDLLLQTLGEGRLTDAAGRVADFSNSVVIMTSNLGAETYQQASIGFGGDPASVQHAQEHFERSVRQFLRPELFNRIDCVVPFAPLDWLAIARIAELQLGLVQQRDGIRSRGVRLTTSPGVAERLAELGCEPRYGARPLRRAIQRTLLAPLSERLNSYSGDLALDVHVGLNAGELRFDVTAMLDEAGRQRSTLSGDQGELGVVASIIALRRKAQAVDHSPLLLEIRNEHTRLEQMRKRRQTEAPGDAAERSREFSHDYRSPRHIEIGAVIDRVTALLAEVERLEDETLLALYGNQPLLCGPLADRQKAAARDLDELLVEVFAVESGGKNAAATVVVLGEYPSLVLMLGQAYWQLAQCREWKPTLYALRSLPGHVKPEPNLWLSSRQTPDAKQATRLAAFRIEPDDAFWEQPPDRLIGLALTTTGRCTFAILESERGLHLFQSGTTGKCCLVDACDGGLIKYVPPAGVDRRGAIGTGQKRRKYDQGAGVAEDPLLGQRLPLDRKNLADVVRVFAERRFEQRLHSILE